MKRILVVACCIVSVLTAPVVSTTPASDRTTQALTKARKTYEKTLLRVTESITEALQDKVKAAASRKGGTDDVDGLLKESQLFVQDGTLPDEMLSTPDYRKYTKAREDLLKAYADAIGKFTSQQMPTQASAVSSEKQTFEKQRDLIPWGSNLVTDPSGATLEAGGTALILEPTIPKDFRLRIRAKATNNAGVLLLMLPLSGKRLELPVRPDDDGEFDVLLSISDGLVSPDLGLPRPVDVGTATTSDSRTITLRSQSETIHVELVQIKPIVNQVPAPFVASGGKRTSEPVEANQPQFGSGTKLTGILWGQSAGKRAASATVQRVDNTGMVLRVKDKFGVNDWYLRFNGRSFAVADIVKVSGTSSQHVNIKTKEGRIGNGTIYWEGSWVWRHENGDSSGANAWLDLQVVK